MDWNRVEGNWKQVKGQVKEKWGKLTDDDLTQINGRRDQLEGKIQERYGVARIRSRRTSTLGTTPRAGSLPRRYCIGARPRAGLFFCTRAQAAMRCRGMP